MTVPMLNPIGLHSQLFDASVQATRRGPAPIVVEELPVIELTRRVAHPVNHTNSASNDAMRKMFIRTVNVL
jgi:hypothetical protein